MYVPELCAHGFQTLEDDTEVAYAISVPHSPDHATGFPYDDPAFAIEWPLPLTVISERDRSWPPLQIAQDASAPARL
jgi:dTDP-4-dehydrorhamnose 3,5-epimerase